MFDWVAGIVGSRLPTPSARTRRIMHLVGVIVAAGAFVLISTILVAYDSIFLGANNVSALQVGDIAPQDIRAPISVQPYVSQVLTAEREQQVRENVAEIYFPPDPGVARQQTDLVQQILDYIENIRQDPYGTLDQKKNDLRQITDLTLSDDVTEQILTMDDATWEDVAGQITSVLERVMRGEIRESNLPAIRTQLPTQVSVRFSEEQADVIVAVVEDLLRPNTLLNQEATDAARDLAAEGTEVRRSFERGQVIVRAGEQIDAASYEALGQVGLFQPADQRLQEIAHALLASIIILVIAGLYLARFQPSLFVSSRFLALFAAMFLIVLTGARITISTGQIYLYPTAALALLYVALSGPEIAVIGIIGLATLIALMQNNSLEMWMLTGMGGLMAALTLRRPERLNGYFMPGLLVALTNVAVIALFYQGALVTNTDDLNLSNLILYSLLNGILAAAVALGGLYIVTVLFNLPTGLKLAELSQPSQALLQRLLREAPGTYQHSLQVANLAEQAANAIGANADLVRVAALYHDIGKILNPSFFTENQVEGVNPHDVLNDPARSANIIISHVTDGDKLARQYRLPSRIRDFIMEHHGTQVLYFYQQAVERAGDEDVVDIEQFTYPGPRPQSRETAVLMLADSSEAAVRSRKPTKKQDIADTVQGIFEAKIRTGQLDESGLTLNDIKNIRKIFVDMLQAVFHPRISYPTNAQPSQGQKDILSPETPHRMPKVESVSQTQEISRVVSGDVRRTTDGVGTVLSVKEAARPTLETGEVPTVRIPFDEGDAPLPDVPPLPRTGDHKVVKVGENGKQAGNTESAEEEAGLYSDDV
jgi:putative nucleotidyltransferase with HDIG domain